MTALPKERQDEFYNFLLDIKDTKFFKPDGKPNPEWKVFYGSTIAEAWEAALDAARAEAWDAAKNTALVTVRDAAWTSAFGAARDAALDAARSRAWSVAWDAVRDIVWTTASDAARVAAGDAVLDAALMAQLIVVKDLDFEDKESHLRRAAERMEVWKKGYGVAADVNGILYVYCVR
jgi:hypothetical protein